MDSVLGSFFKFKQDTSSSFPEQDKRLHFVIQELNLTTDYLLMLCDSFVNELQLGLECHSKDADDPNNGGCCFKMLDTCVSKIPNGLEKGSSLAIDFGGTNLRAVLVSLKGNGICEGIQKSYNLKAAGMMKSTTTATEMFEYIAKCLKDVKSKGQSLEGHSLDNEILNIGFTFSFPFLQKTLTEMQLVEWTKGFETGRDTNDPVEGRDAGKQLQAALDKLQVGAELKAVLNDTVGTLISCCYEVRKKRLHSSASDLDLKGTNDDSDDDIFQNKREHVSDFLKKPNVESISMKEENNVECSTDNEKNSHDNKKIYTCLVGIILGTGMNACYVEPHAFKYGYKGIVINTECGNFYHSSFPLTSVDMEIDSLSTNKGKQLFEKMISGFYLGELVRRFAIKVFQKRTPDKVWCEHSFTGEDAAVILNDTTRELTFTKACLKRCWNISDECDIKTIRKIVSAVLSRSAAFSAVSIAAIAIKTENLDEGISVGVDGSLYTKNPWYKARIREHLVDILGERASLVNIEIANDGSGKGAGILAALF